MRKLFLFLVCLILISFTISTNALVQSDLDKLLKTKKCPEGALTRANLKDKKLHNAYLFCSNLAGADLTKADLHGAYLSGANLVAADIIEANLSKAILSGTNLFWADLTKADLTEANLSGANITGANFTDAKFKDTIWVDGEKYSENPWTPQKSEKFNRTEIRKKD